MHILLKEERCQKTYFESKQFGFQNMEQRQDYLRDACVELKELIEFNKKQLDIVQEDIEARDPGSKVPHSHIEKASSVATHESLKHNLATLQGGLKVSDCRQNVNAVRPSILINVARLWQMQSSSEILEILMEEKLKQVSLQEECKKKTDCLNENKKLLEVLLKEKKCLENQQEELEKIRISELEEKLARAKRLYGEMKIHLKETVETFFPDPEIRGFTGVYSLLNELTQRLQNRERDAYIEVKSNIYPFYLETLERHGIIERHPTDRQKIRIIDFSDGSLGS